MTPEDFNYFQSRVTRFISGSSSGMKFGTPLTPKYTRLSRIVPKRILPQQLLERIQKKTISDDDGGVETDTKGITSLGKVTLNLEYTKNNLEKILQIIAEDYKNSQKQNKKELDEYRKRIANRGRIFGKKELGDNKSDVLGTVKKYVGSFFSGAGGSIRALALFNLLQGILSGDPSKIIGPLLGIGMTYIPSIIGSVIGGVIGGVGKSLVGKLLGGGAKAAGGVGAGLNGAAKFGGKAALLGGGAKAAAPAAGAAAGGVGAGLNGAAKFGGKAALLGGGLALASGIMNRPQEDDQQQRLEELTQQQKSSVDSQSLVPIPQNELKRFDNLNKKFEEALDFLLKKQKEGSAPRSQPSAGGGVGGGTSGGGSPSVGGQLIKGNAPSEVKTLMDMISSPESGGNYEAMYPSTTLPGATDMTISEVARKATGPVGRYQHKLQFLEKRSRSVGLDPSKDKFSPENQDLITRGHLASLYSGGESELVSDLKKDPSKVKRKLESSTYTGLQKYGSDFNTLFSSRMAQYGSSPQVTQLQTQPSVQMAAPRTSTRRNVPAVSPTPRVTVVPVPVSTQPQQQTSSASPASSIVPPIDTTYPENFLALYSKLTYQIV